MNILIVAAGTGGHVYPALSVARKFTANSLKVHWLGKKDSLEEKISQQEKYVFLYHNPYAYRGRNFIKKVYSFFTLCLSFINAIFFLVKVKPRLVFSTGNYSSLGPGFAAILLKIPLFIHEQNRVPGRVNKLLKPFSCLTFEGFKGSFPDSPKVKYVGNPIRNEFFKKKERLPSLNHSLDNLKILILGGSQGSTQLNYLISDILIDLPNPNRFFIHHQSGKKDKYFLDQKYKSAGVNSLVEEFIGNISDAMFTADLIISRAGAMTLSEIAFLSKPSILIPLPWSTDNHQFENALYMQNLGAAILIDSSNYVKKELLDLIKSLLTNREKLEEMGKLAKLASIIDSSDQIFNYIYESI